MGKKGKKKEKQKVSGVEACFTYLPPLLCLIVVGMLLYDLICPWKEGRHAVQEKHPGQTCIALTSATPDFQGRSTLDTPQARRKRPDDRDPYSEEVQQDFILLPCLRVVTASKHGYESVQVTESSGAFAGYFLFYMAVVVIATFYSTPRIVHDLRQSGLLGKKH